MKIPCEIIRDLLPLYHDEVCSEESKAMVEDHLTSCDHCRNELQAIVDSFSTNQPEFNMKEAEALQNLSKRWKKGMFKSLLKGVFMTLSIFVLMLLVMYLFMDINVVPKP